METLLGQRSTNGDSEKKRPAVPDENGDDRKRQRTIVPMETHSSDVPTALTASYPARQVQKFRYHPAEANANEAGGYRTLLATYADIGAAAEDDPIKVERIKAACHAGGNFVGDYYYQYEVCVETAQLLFLRVSSRRPVVTLSSHALSLSRFHRTVSNHQNQSTMKQIRPS